MAGLVVAGFGLTSDWSHRDPAPAALSPVAAPTTREASIAGSRGPQLVEGSVGEIPTGMSIPALQVEAAVVPASTVDGVLMPPSDPQQLGWWRGGARPGASRGRVLVTGHTVHTGGGALDHLGDLASGDRIVVTTTKGLVAYAVETVTYYPKQTLADDASATFSQSGAPRLVLITCERWNGTSYDGNTVVVARPVDR